LDLARLGRYAEALKDYDRLLTLVPPTDVEVLRVARVMRAVALARTGDHIQAIDEVEKILRDDPQYSTAYDAACVYAVVAGDVSDRGSKERCAAKAMALLCRAADLSGDFLAGGRFTPPMPDHDRDLDALRMQEDFNRLLSAVDSARRVQRGY
jgi:tetratricopeptide (TPR) repeat protein